MTLARAIGFLAVDRSHLSNCHIRITAPRDGDETAQTINEGAASLGCRVDYQPANDLKPEIEEEALQGAADNEVIIHAPKGSPSTEDFIQTMSLLVCVKRKYDGERDQPIWLQIGHGFPWRFEDERGMHIGGLPKSSCPVGS